MALEDHDRPIGIGLIGFDPPRSWGAASHVPAIASLSDDYSLVGIANSSAASARAAAATLDGVAGFASADDLVRSPQVDLVAITVKVPHHAALVRLALTAGKHVLCEWPLASSLEEAGDLVALARDAGVVAAVVTQAPHAPAIARLRTMVDQGALGDLLSATIVGNGMKWGDTIERRNAYLLNPANGATMLTIAVGHMLSAIEASIGRIATVSATCVTRRSSAIVRETGERIPQSTADQVLLACTTADGLPIALHYRGGMPRGPGLSWQVDGIGGSARITSSSGLVELAPLTLETRRDGDEGWTVDTSPVEQPIVDGVARLYRSLAEAIRGRPSDVPRFADALRLHAIIAAIQRSAESGRRVAVEA